MPDESVPTAETSLLRLIGLGAIIGIPAALLAVLFLAVVHTLEEWLWTDLPEHLDASSPPWYLVVGLPVVGGVLVWIARRFLPGDGGHSPLDGIGGGVTPLRHAPGIALAALGTLAFGAVLGPEAPLIALGSVVGAVLVSFVDVDDRGRQVVAMAGSFSAVSALFGGPLVAGILLLEVGLAAGAALTPLLLPGLVAAAVGYTLFIGFGDWGGIDRATLTVPGLPVHDGTRVNELLLAIVVGVAAAGVIAAARQVAHRVGDQARQRVGPGLVAGGLAVGLLALAADGLGGDPRDVLFSGQTSVPALVVETSAATLLVVLVAKALGYAISLGCGFRGGPVFPAIFIGIGIATFFVIWFDLSATWAVGVGTAAGMAAGSRLVFSSLLFATIIVGPDAGSTLPAAVLGVTAAWVTTTAIRSRWPEPAPAAG